MIYLDNAATTFPKPEEVYVAMDKVNRMVVNSGRGAYKAAYCMSQIISDTKCEIRKLIGADINVPVVFSPSITIALNQIINGLNYSEGVNVYVSPYEHNAVARSIEKIKNERRINVIELPLNDRLEIDFEKLKYLFSKNKPAYIFCTHVSNVTGYILPIKEIFEEGKKYKSINVLDTAQSMGLLDVNINELKADIIAFAGHKTLYGPLGIGGFINVSHIELAPFITGGTGSDSLNLHMPDNLEGKYEAASSNVIAIAGLQAALKSLDVSAHYSKEKELTEYLIEELSNMKGIKLFVPEKEKRVGIVSFIIDGYNSDDIGTILDEDYDIAVRTGFHCAPFIHKYLKDERVFGTVRVGLSQFNTITELDTFVSAIKEMCEG